MRVLNVGFFGDFDMFSSAGYFNIEESTDINELNRNFIIKLLKKNNFKILSDNNNHLKVINFKEKKKYNIKFENNTIYSDNGFPSLDRCNEYTRYLKDLGFKEIKAAKVIINHD